jgi:hypothetical protein
MNQLCRIPRKRFEFRPGQRFHEKTLMQGEAGRVSY